jgi:tetraacyldisaccharide 4'-kinase
MLAVNLYKRICKTHSFTIPIICIGNLTSGGTGKTPTTMAITERLKSMGYKPHIVSRGYGGRERGPLRVDERLHEANDVGDEPLLLSHFAPTWVSKKKIYGVKAAINAGADIIILDDGFQNMSIRKNLSIIVADADLGFGNGRIIPAGPLRETITSGLKRMDLLISVGSVESQKKFRKKYKYLIPEKDHIQATIVPIVTGLDWKGLRVFAFAGIGNPEKFFNTLSGLGADIVLTKKLADHKKFDNKLLSRLSNEAVKLNAQLVTTEKDAIRLPLSFRKKILTLPIRLDINKWEVLDEALQKILTES